MRHYLRVYAEFLRINAAKSMSFRMNFILMLLLDLVFYATNIWTYELVLQNLGTGSFWPREHFMLYVGFIMFIDWVHTFTVGSSFWQFSTVVRKGDLDYALLRPIHPLFTTFGQHIRFECILNVIPATAIIVHYALQAKLSPFAWAMLPVMALLSFAFTTVLDISLTLLVLWTQEGMGIHFMRFQMHQMARWPDFIYRGGARLLFTVGLPALLYYSPYVRFLVNPADWRPLLLGLGMLLAWGILMFKGWDFSIRRYESASS